MERTTALRPRQGGVSKLDLRVIADLMALLIEKRLGGIVSARFILFTGVGVSGIVVNVAILGVLLATRIDANLAWIAAIFLSMAWNFGLNNQLTFRDQRLRGSALLRGFATFVAACAVGAVANFGMATALYRLGVAWVLAAVVGALAAGVFNFLAVRRVTWSRKA